MYKLRCPVCRAIEREFFFIEKVNNIPISIAKCRKCGLVYTIPVTFQREKRDSKSVLSSKKEKSNLYLDEWWSILVYLKHYISQNPRLLEIGCSRGLFLDMAKKFGYKTEGVELDNINAKESISKGHKVFTGDILDINLPHQYADVVVMLHTLEHLKHLELVFKKVSAILKDDGLIIIEVPNLWYWILQRKLFVSRSLAPERHLYHFTPQTLLKLIKISGFRILKIEPANRYDKKKIIIRIFQFVTKIFSNCIFFLTGIILSNSIRIYAKKI